MDMLIRSDSGYTYNILGIKSYGWHVMTDIDE